MFTYSQLQSNQLKAIASILHLDTDCVFSFMVYYKSPPTRIQELGFR